MSRLRGPWTRGRRGQDGQATLELIAGLPIVLVMTAVVLQFGAFVWAITDVTEAVREGARASSQGEDGCAAARSALSAGSRSGTTCTSSGGTLRLSTPAPRITSLLPGFTITRTAVMPDVANI